MGLAIMPLDEFLQLDTEAQVESLKRWKLDYTLKDIRDTWGFKHSAQYYMLLKKLRIYERVVNKSDKFYPEQLLGSRSAESRGYGYPSLTAVPGRQRGDHFAYQMNTTMDGADLADKLERIAYFLKGENKSVHVRLSIEALDEPERGAEPEREAEAGG